ncbi:MAG: ABC transporter ATP-binding protein [Myxococcaceae bacterium]|nr:ABC transporter ATP-binding protein [Myxococcaceae bacterium]
MITARGLSRLYVDNDGSAVRVLDGLDLFVGPGEFVAIVGPSGSGKSTLLHVLGGLDVHYRGEVIVDGVTLGGLSDAALARFRNQHVGFVFQSFHLIPNLSAAENVMLPAFFGGGTPGGKERRRAEEVLERVGLGRKRDRAPTQLSGGERQRVAIGRALFCRPKVLFCDEPTGNLDAATGQEIIDIFRGLNQDGLTVLTVTHEERMSAAAARVLRLCEGRLVEEGASR